ncbi:MAG TPA: 30S ribosomal protein S6 [Candidatus Paceibacterota bacterium]|nr:30S ribosomal protein S6 [Candidatus Paceibacterota bacterium]
MNETDKTAGTVYEVGFHIVPTVSPENLPKEVDAIKAVLAKNGAVTISEEFPKLRALAYQMIKAVGPARHRCDSAYFGWIKFEAPKAAIAEINKAMDANEKVLRYITVKTVKEDTLYGAKLLAQEEAAKAAQKPAAPAAELDKTIDKMVA